VCVPFLSFLSIATSVLYLLVTQYKASKTKDRSGSAAARKELHKEIVKKIVK
jgi:hypothetical protein